MTDFYADFHGQLGLSAEQFFYKQVFDSFKANTENHTLPFFNKDLNKIPRELSTGKIINNENSIALEQIASLKGYKSNLWIYGDELNKIQKEVGDLYYKKGTQPVLCLTKYFNSSHLTEQDLYVSEGGSGRKEQYLYNFDSLDERSQQKLQRFYGLANEIDKNYTKENLKAFSENCVANQIQKSEVFTKARERANDASRQNGMNLSVITNCHYLHNLSNSIGQPDKSHDKTEPVKDFCYETANKFNQKITENGISPQKAGMMLCTALNAGTEFQRISVAKGYNLENAKKVEELKVAQANREKPYRKYSGGFGY